MKRRCLMMVLLSLLLCMPFILPVSAAYPYLVDRADILTANEESALLAELTEISTEYGVTVAVVTVDSLGNQSAKAYANDFYDKNYGATTDGVMLLLAMDEREYYIVTESFGRTAIPDGRIDYVANRFVPDLSDGEYYEGFMTYASICAEHIKNAKNGNPYTEPLLTFSDILIALAVGIVISLIIVSALKNQLKSVRMQPMARAYVREGSLNLTRQNDYFLYRNVTRRQKQNKSSRSGSSGSSRGGGGGRF